VHRGKAAVLQAMSLVLYSRFVVRRKKEQKVIDYFRYFPFDSHYEMHHAGFIQEIRIGDNNVVVPMQLRLPSEQEQPEKHYSTLLLLCNAFDGCASSAHCAIVRTRSGAFLAMTSRLITSRRRYLLYFVHVGDECMLA